MGPTIRTTSTLFRALARRLAVACSIALAMLLASPAGAQLQRISPETAQSVQLSGSQRQEIESFVAAYAPLAFGEDPAEAGPALENLLDPLRAAGVSVAFRQAMAEQLSDEMSEALADGRVLLDDGTINAAPYAALRLAGEMATETTLGMIRGALDSEDDGRRFFAVYATELVFYAISNAAPAVTVNSIYATRGQTASGLVPELGERLGDEESARHAAALVRALAEAAQIRDEQFAEAARAALVEIGNATSARIKAGRDEDAPTPEERLVWMTAGQELTRSVAQGGGGSSSAEAGRAAVRLAGHLIASVYRDFEAGRLPPADERGGEAAVFQRQTLELARNLLTFGDQAMATASRRPPSRELDAAASSIVDAFLGRANTNFRQVALSLISPEGSLTAPPYGFADDEFVSR